MSESNGTNTALADDFYLTIKAMIEEQGDHWLECPDFKNKDVLDSDELSQFFAAFRSEVYNAVILTNTPQAMLQISFHRRPMGFARRIALANIASFTG